MRKYIGKSVAYFFVIAILGGCAETAELKATRPGANAGDPSAGLAQFSDIPIPPAATMDVARSLILGTRTDWIGRVVFTTSLATQEAFSFFGREMPAFGWQEVTRVRAETSVLTFVRGERAATIQITRPTLGSTEVNLTVSPVRRATGSAGAPGPQ